MVDSRSWSLLFLALALFVARPALAQPDPIRIKIVGGLADVRQFTTFEEPFWRERIPAATGGRVVAEISAFDRSGIRGQEVLQLMRLGVVPYGTALLALAATEEPELNGADLVAVSPDMPALRRTVAAYRPHLREILAERYGLELLAIYTYSAQVLFCRNPFTGLSDLRGRRIRTSSVGMSEAVAALGAVPVVTPFAELMPAMRSGQVECAVTGTLSGNGIGLHEVSTHVHSLALTWGLSIFAVNQAAWMGMPEDLRGIIAREIGVLEARIWDAAAEETGDGLACNSGATPCRMGRRGRMTLVPVSPADEALRRRLLSETVLPGWVRRCGVECVDAWNHTIGPELGLMASPE
ncbi:TRAP transporter substrate-binding protein [Plastoroseomonas arctica]|uniref:TRAP transporter substrate-binding protein n=1 Tax=Plastoroseomonas arctica TaxID=1509237 RepID=UPI001FE6542E|nr:TRAP transporter substrate-binding protein [Plastoroseomonas arctica]